MKTYNRYIQFISNNEKAMSIFNSIKKTSDSRMGIVETGNGAKLGPSRTFTCFSLASQAEFMGLTTCSTFEGFSLVYDGGDLILTTAEPTYVDDGSVTF